MLSLLNPVTIQDEAARRYLKRPLAILENIYHQARLQRDEAQAPILDPPSVSEARTWEAEAQRCARDAVAEAEGAKARRDALAALTPRGWRLAWWWADRRLQRHRAAISEAEGLARAAEQMAVARGRVATGPAFGVEVALEKAVRWKQAEARRRRQVEADASLHMEQAALAADLLRDDPGLGGLSIPDLLGKAGEVGRRRRIALLAREAQEAVGSNPRGPR